MKNQEKIRVGIAGTGKIIPEAVAAMQATGWEVTAIWGRHGEKAREKGLFLFETISNIYLPVWAAVKEHLPRIGTVKLFQADFSQFSSRYEDYLDGVIGSAPSTTPSS